MVTGDVGVSDMGERYRWCLFPGEYILNRVNNSAI